MEDWAVKNCSHETYTYRHTHTHTHTHTLYGLQGACVINYYYMRIALCRSIDELYAYNM